MNSRMKPFSIIALMAVLPVFLHGQSELPLHQKKLSEKALLVWTGDYMQTIAVAALATSKGIVVIDTSLVRSLDARIRRAIEKEFGRSDFKYLVNTHYHHDHTAGNQIYADATIVGHKTVPAGMKSELTGEGLAKQVEKFKGMSKDWGERLQKAAPGSRDHNFFREGVAFIKLAIEELQDGFRPAYPSILFEKNLILDMGDMTIELYSFGGTHTDSDIMIFVPEEGLVALGDVAPEQMLPYIRKDLTSDFAVTLEHWGKIAEGYREIQFVNMAHSDMRLSVETFKEQHKYLHALWRRLSEMSKQGLTLEDAKKATTIQNDFPYFKDKIIETRRGSIHLNNIEAIWDQVAKK